MRPKQGVRTNPHFFPQIPERGKKSGLVRTSLTLAEEAFSRRGVGIQTNDTREQRRFALAGILSEKRKGETGVRAGSTELPGLSESEMELPPS